MGGVCEKHARLSVQREPVTDSRSTPSHRPVESPIRRAINKAGEFDPDLHLEYKSSTEAAMGWSRGLCIQLASIHFSAPGIHCWKQLDMTRGGHGAVAQLGERLICTQEVAGSIPTSSTSNDGVRQTNGPVAQMARAHP